MRADPLPVTVVIPAYRRPDMVERAVRSVLAQTRPPAEVLVVDDCSGDDTGARAASLGARVLTHERNMGEGAARNTGLRAASHDWVALLDCDDEWLPEHVETLWGARDGHVLVGDTALMTGSEHRVLGWAGPRALVMRGPADVAVPENKLCVSAVMVRRDDALEAGGFRDLVRGADLDMWLRLLERGSGVATARVTTLYHVHAGQISSDQEPMWLAREAVLDAYADRPWRTRAVRRRHEGVVAWDTARAALAGGAPRAGTLLMLARRLSPQRALGLAQALAGRFRGRRLASRFAPGGGPSVAIMPGAAGEGSIDLRDRGTVAALAYLVRRPAARARVAGGLQAAAVRALRIEPER